MKTRQCEAAGGRERALDNLGLVTFISQAGSAPAEKVWGRTEAGRPAPGTHGHLGDARDGRESGKSTQLELWVEQVGKQKGRGSRKIKSR